LEAGGKEASQVDNWIRDKKLEKKKEGRKRK
jgi:hypothetical protein